MNWKYISRGEYPQTTQKEIDEILCLVYYRGRYTILCWNAHYQCWDDEEGDDCVCDKEEVSKWEYLDAIINTLDSNELNVESKENKDSRDIFNRSTPYFSFID